MQYKERIKEYQEEVVILEELLKYEAAGDKENAEKLRKKHNQFKLKLEVNTKKARLHQLEQLMAQAKKTLEAEKKVMKTNWKAALKKSMDIKDKLKKDDKRLIMAFKDRDIKKAWQSDEEKLQAYKTIMNIINQICPNWVLIINSNGKSI